MNDTTVLLLILCLFVLGIYGLPLLATEAEAQKPQNKAKKRHSKAVDELRKKLKTMVLGDERIIERLLEQQRRKHPGESEEQHLRRILDAWQNDHRR